MNLKSILLFGSAIALTGSSYGQTFVTTGGEKHALLEEATGTWCQWCPDGAQVIQEAIHPYGANPNYPKCVTVSFHNGGSDKMTLPGDPFNSPVSAGGTGYITGFPGGTVDRTPYTPVGTAVSVYRRYWDEAVAAREALSPKFDVSMVCLYDTATRKIDIELKAKALTAVTGNYRMNVYIVQDSIPSNASGFRQVSASAINAGTYTSETGSPTWYAGFGTSIADSTKYSHMDVVRKILASGGSIWGDTAFTGGAAVGDSVVRTYSYTIPASINGSNCYPKYTRVVGLISKHGAATTDREIENCIDAKVRLMDAELPNSVAGVTKGMQDIDIYPNPAQNFIGVKGILLMPSEVNVSIINSVGQQVLTKNFKKGSSMFGEFIETSQLSNGVYFLNVTTDGGTVTKQFTISK